MSMDSEFRGARRASGPDIVIDLHRSLPRRAALTLLLAFVVGFPAWMLASSLVLPNQFANDDIADADEVNADFTSVADAVGDNDLRLQALERKLASFEVDGDTLRIAGVNVQVVDGSGGTDGRPNGRGNVIVGYNEDTFIVPHDRSGSHNLVVGPEHSYSSYGGLVAGFANTVGAPYASVLGGRRNESVSEFATIAGGSDQSTLESGDWIAGCADDMAAVGSICMDKFEASVRSSPDGGTQYGATEDDYPCDDDGQDCSGIYARSLADVVPSWFATYFQAQQACANAGKRLASSAEWQMAAAGTPNGPPCVSGRGNTGNPGCVSRAGVFDMAGSVWEWVADWLPRSTRCYPTGWPSGFSEDVICLMGADESEGPGALIRGGSGFPPAGPFAVEAILSPFEDVASGPMGLRCAR